MFEINGLTCAAFFLSTSLVLLTGTLVSGRKTRLDVRLDELAGHAEVSAGDETVVQLAQSVLPRMGAALVPHKESRRTRLQTRLIHAGLYDRQAMPLFLGVRLVLMIGPVVVGALADFSGLTEPISGLIAGAALGDLGFLGPSFWLDWKKKKRQIAFRRALPDALDVIVICMEGGQSLAGALRRVAMELRQAHPLLAAELDIVQREVQLGRSTGEALRQFADRIDMEELRTLAGVIIQSERFGAGLVKALRVHADALRTKRLQYAEEMAQKAATKMLFPTVLFILPAMLIVILAPAVFKVTEMFIQVAP